MRLRFFYNRNNNNFIIEKRHDLRQCRIIFTSWREITEMSRREENRIELMSRWRLVSTYFRKWNAFANKMKAQRAKARLEFQMKRSRKLCRLALEFRTFRLLSRSFKSWSIFTQSQREQREIRSRHHRRQAQMTALLREKKQRHEEARRKEKKKIEEEEVELERQRKEVEERRRQQNQVVTFNH